MQMEQDISPSCRLRVYLYGPLEVWTREASGIWNLVEKDAWGKGRAARSVFKRLLAVPGRRLSRGTIQDDLWPDTENFELADKSIYNAINQIRRVTGKTLLRTLETSYEIADQSLVWVDSDACETLLKEVENQGYTSLQALPLLEQALAILERGELLEGEGGTWVYGLRKKSEDLLRQCRLWLAENYETHGKPLQASLQYRALLQTIPPDEDALQRWMAMLQRQGKVQEALKCFHDAKVFFEEQGCTLSPLLQHLVNQIETQSRQEIELSNSPLVQGIFSLEQDIIIPKQILAGPMDLLRRKFLQDTGAVLLPLFFDSKQKNSATLDEIVSHGKNIVKACWHLMKGKEIRIAEELLSAYTPTLLHMVFQPSSYQRAIAQVATQACMIRAIIAKHYLNSVAREMYCHEAIQCSRLAGDKALHAGALMYLGYTYTFCNPLRPQKAIEIFLEALREIENVDDLVKSDICIGLADAYALVNNESQAKHAIHMAQDSFPSRPEQHSSFFYADCALDTLYQWEAKMYLDLAQHDQQQNYYKNAWTILEQSIKIHAVSERCMIETVIYQTTAALGLHDLDRYVSCLKEGASTALQIGSQRRYQEAIDLYQLAPKNWKQELQIQDIAAFFQENHRKEKQI